MTDIKDRLIIFNIRKWETGLDPSIEDLFIGQTLDKDTVVINPNDYKKLPNTTFQGKEVYAYKYM